MVNKQVGYKVSHRGKRLNVGSAVRAVSVAANQDLSRYHSDAVC